MRGDCLLARPTQGSRNWRSRLFLLVGLGLAASLAGCGSKGFSLEDAVPDMSVTTGSVPAGITPDSDEWTIRNVVSSALVSEVGEKGIGWANVVSGSSGTIRNIRESRAGGVLCRDFSATRESYEGVFLYEGQACMASANLWSMNRFERVE